MTREIKIGMAVAGSLMSLVGVVVGTKMYQGDIPRPIDPAAVAQNDAKKDAAPPPATPSASTPGTLPATFLSETPLPQPTPQTSSGFPSSPPAPPSPPGFPALPAPTAVDLPKLPDIGKPFVDAGSDLAKNLEKTIDAQNQAVRNTIEQRKNDLTSAGNKLIDDAARKANALANQLKETGNKALDDLPNLPEATPFTLPPVVADNTIVGGGGRKPKDPAPPPSFTPNPPMPPAAPNFTGDNLPPVPDAPQPRSPGFTPPAPPGVPPIPTADPLPPPVGIPPVGGPPVGSPPVGIPLNGAPPVGVPPVPIPEPTRPLTSSPPVTVPVVPGRPAIDTPAAPIVAGEPPNASNPEPIRPVAPSTPIRPNPDAAIPIVPGPPSDFGNPVPTPPTAGLIPPTPGFPATPQPPVAPPIAPPIAPPLAPPVAPPIAPPVAPPIVRSDSPQRYVCQGNENYALIAARTYGNENLGRALEEYNRDLPNAADNVRAQPARLMPETVVWLPSRNVLTERYARFISAPTPAIATPFPPGPPTRPLTNDVGLNAPMPLTKTPAANAGVTTYRVPSSGMYLAQVAERQLGSPLRWIEIYQLNPGLQPEQPLREGMEIRVPLK